LREKLKKPYTEVDAKVKGKKPKVDVDAKGTGKGKKAEEVDVKNLHVDEDVKERKTRS